MEGRSICLSVSKRNKDLMQVVEDYSLQYNLPTSATIFRIIREHDKMTKWEIYNRAPRKKSFLLALAAHKKMPFGKC